MKRVYKYGTGDIIPSDAIYLCTIKNGDMNDSNIDYPCNYKYVWHYFLVEDK